MYLFCLLKESRPAPFHITDSRVMSRKGETRNHSVQKEPQIHTHTHKSAYTYPHCCVTVQQWADYIFESSFIHHQHQRPNILSLSALLHFSNGNVYTIIIIYCIHTARNQIYIVSECNYCYTHIALCCQLLGNLIFHLTLFVFYYSGKLR